MKSIVMQISFIMLIFLLFSGQISGGRKSPRGQTFSEGTPCGRKPGEYINCPLLDISTMVASVGYP